MASTAEAPSREVTRTAPPVAELANMEASKGITRVADPMSAGVVSKSNGFVKKMIDRGFLAFGNLGRKTFGVGRISSVMKGLSSLVRGL